ncbi:MAG: M23 family metallopeptidase, partial [Actinomycetota bacterium]|nr:M23 family metallopeptidase [Actinomycetota bacterium]
APETGGPDEVAQAAATLGAVRNRLSEAEAAYREATRAAETARAAGARLADQERATRVAIDTVNERLARTTLRVDEHQGRVGRLARQMYMNGAQAQLALASTILDADSPQDATERIVLTNSVTRSELHTVDELSERRRAQEEDRERLRAEHRRLAALQARALRMVAAAETAQARAGQEQVRVAQLAEEAAEALVEAEAAKAADAERQRLLREEAEALLSASAEWQVPPSAHSRLLRPAVGQVTSSFGPRFHPILRYTKLHTGVDFAAGDGVIRAATDGVVVSTGAHTAYGNVTLVAHGALDGAALTTLYAHQARILVSPGDSVRRGQQIGVIGSTGYSTGPHLHFEVRLDGRPVDPMPFLR